MNIRHPFDLAFSELQELNLDFNQPSIFVELCLLCHLDCNISGASCMECRRVATSRLDETL